MQSAAKRDFFLILQHLPPGFKRLTNKTKCNTVTGSWHVSVSHRADTGSMSGMWNFCE